MTGYGQATNTMQNAMAQKHNQPQQARPPQQQMDMDQEDKKESKCCGLCVMM